MMEQRYVLKEVCDARHAGIEQRLESIEKKLDQLLTPKTPAEMIDKGATWLFRAAVMILLAKMGVNNVQV